MAVGVLCNGLWLNQRRLFGLVWEMVFITVAGL